jgi:surface protein
MQRWWSGDCDDPPPRLTSYKTIVVVRMACEFVCILPRCVPISFIISALFSFIIICMVDWRFFWSIYRLVQRFFAQSKYESFHHRTTETYLGWRQRTNGGRIAVSLTTQQLHPDLYRIYIFLLDTAEWDTSKVVDMSETFYEASSFQGVGVSTWDVSSVTNMHDMHDMFGKGHSFNADLSAWDVRQVTSMAQMVRQRAMFKCCAASFNTCT